MAQCSRISHNILMVPKNKDAVALIGCQVQPFQLLKRSTSPTTSLIRPQFITKQNAATEHWYQLIAQDIYVVLDT